MNIGLLWFDDDPGHSLAERIGQAVAHYQARFGLTPNLCYVNPRALEQGAPAIAGLRLAPAQAVAPEQLWLGVAGVAGEA
jgi:hypothetical protein